MSQSGSWVESGLTQTNSPSRTGRRGGAGRAHRGYRPSRDKVCRTPVTASPRGSNSGVVLTGVSGSGIAFFIATFLKRKVKPSGFDFSGGGGSGKRWVAGSNLLMKSAGESFGAVGADTRWWMNARSKGGVFWSFAWFRRNER